MRVSELYALGSLFTLILSILNFEKCSENSLPLFLLWDVLSKT